MPLQKMVDSHCYAFRDLSRSSCGSGEVFAMHLLISSLLFPKLIWTCQT